MIQCGCKYEYVYTLKPPNKINGWSTATLRMTWSLTAVPENTPSSSVSSVGSLATPLGTEVVSRQSEGKGTVTGGTEDSISAFGIGLVGWRTQLHFL